MDRVARKQTTRGYARLAPHMVGVLGPPPGKFQRHRLGSPHPDRIARTKARDVSHDVQPTVPQARCVRRLTGPGPSSPIRPGTQDGHIKLHRLWNEPYSSLQESTEVSAEIDRMLFQLRTSDQRASNNPGNQYRQQSRPANTNLVERLPFMLPSILQLGINVHSMQLARLLQLVLRIRRGRRVRRVRAKSGDGTSIAQANSLDQLLNMRKLVRE